MTSLLLFAKTVTLLHVGSGRSADTDIDLPIARERLTNWPVVPGTGVKGALRGRRLDEMVRDDGDYRAVENDPRFIEMFGRASGGDEGSQAGSLDLTDLRMVAMGVRSFYGGFAYVVCPMSLARLQELADALAIKGSFHTSLRPENDENALVPKFGGVESGKRVFLEDVDLTAQEADLSSVVNTLAGPLGRDSDDLARRLVLVSDTVFTSLTETGTEVQTKVRLDPDTKSARDNMLRTEESVPPESLFAGGIVFERVKGSNPEMLKTQFLDSFNGKTLRLGGKATTGHGICRITILGVE